jgi:hypothetical protein
MSGAIPPLPNTPSWRGAQLKHRDNFTFTFAGPNGRTYCLRPLEHWDHGFESHSRHGCVSAFFCVVLSCVGRGLASG